MKQKTTKNLKRGTERSYRKEEEKDSGLKNETLQSIVAILFFIGAFFLLIASFGKGGTLGEVFFNFFHKLSGVGYYLMPVSLVILGTAFGKNIAHRFPILKMLSGLIFFLAGLGLIEIASSGNGGSLGTMISKPLIYLFDVYTSIALLSAFIIISLLIIFDTHLKRDFLFFWKKKDDLFEDDEDDLEDLKVSSGGERVKKESLINTEKENLKESQQKTQKLDPVVATKKPEPEEESFIKGTPILHNKTYTPPPLSLLENDKGKPQVGDIKAQANIIKRTLQNFGINVEMDEVTIGPTVTRYTLKPAEGVKLSRIVGLQDNLALALAAQSIRIEAPVPGKSLVGIEVPNTAKTTVGLGTLMGSKEFQNSDKPLLMGIGKNVSGEGVFYDLAKMPHLLIAGTTGSGKSVTVHALLTSLLYRNSPDMLKFIMVDAKRVELTLYNKIPHLLTPVITDAKKTILALKWAAKEMDRRYNVLETQSVRDISSYHKNIVAPALKAYKGKEGETVPETMPYIVVVIDELADLMQAYPRELESSIVRLAQMSRAVGIHLVLSTQRPSVNVITGLIKANIPTRIALKVGSQIDSRTIIDKAGAEKLVGQGDMLFSSQERPEPVRIQSPYISENELKGVVKYIVDAYKDEIPATGITLGDQGGETEKNALFDGDAMQDDADDDDLYEDAREVVIQAGKASTSYIQRKLRVGYSRAARLMDILEAKGVIGPADGSKPREVLEGKASDTSEETV